MMERDRRLTGSLRGQRVRHMEELTDRRRTPSHHQSLQQTRCGEQRSFLRALEMHRITAEVGHTAVIRVRKKSSGVNVCGESLWGTGEASRWSSVDGWIAKLSWSAVKVRAFRDGYHCSSEMGSNLLPCSAAT